MQVIGHSESLKRIAYYAIGFQVVAILAYSLNFLVMPDSSEWAVFSGCVAIIASLSPVFYVIQNKCLPILFSSIAVFNIAPIWFLYLESVLPGYEAFIYSLPRVRVEAYIWVSLFLAIFNILYVFVYNRINNFGSYVFSFLGRLILTSSFFYSLALFSFVFPLIAFYVYYDSFDILWQAATAGRSGGGSSGGLLIQDSIGSSSSLMLPISWLWQLTPIFAVLGFFSKPRNVLVTFASIFCAGLVIFSFFLSGSRGNMIFVISPVIFFIVYFNWSKGLKFWLFIMLLFVMFIGAMELQVRFRGNLLSVLSDPTKAAKENHLSKATTFDLTESHRDNNMYLLCLIVKSFPSKYQFEGFHEFSSILLNPIPRTIWPTKPVLKGAKDLDELDYFILEGPQDIGTTSLTYSVVGEAFKANGVIGFFVYALLYAIFFVFFDSLVGYALRNSVIGIALLGSAIFLAFWGFRSLNAFITFTYPLILFTFLFWLISLFKKER